VHQSPIFNLSIFPKSFCRPWAFSLSSAPLSSFFTRCACLPCIVIVLVCILIDQTGQAGQHELASLPSTVPRATCFFFFSLSRPLSLSLSLFFRLACFVSCSTYQVGCQPQAHTLSQVRMGTNFFCSYAYDMFLCTSRLNEKCACASNKRATATMIYDLECSRTFRETG
jgi:hypothetical protein